jgi:hypothetical protein
MEVTEYFRRSVLEDPHRSGITVEMCERIVEEAEYTVRASMKHLQNVRLSYLKASKTPEHSTPLRNIAQLPTKLRLTTGFRITPLRPAFGSGEDWNCWSVVCC